METKHFLWFLIALIIGILVYQTINRKNLYHNFVLTKGKIVNYESWKTRKVEFRIDNLQLNENATMVIPFQSCGDEIYNNLELLKGLEFPVIYSKENTMNHEILIYIKQYEKLGLEIPDSLNSIVELSPFIRTVG